MRASIMIYEILDKTLELPRLTVIFMMRVCGVLLLLLGVRHLWPSLREGRTWSHEKGMAPEMGK